ncbi:conserved hypothetical protein [Neospora caninum Liverpool]|uniref:Cyclin-U4-1 n=1 Tax=Neospora caninum (strain Liverpool) TaxID=572307 RepID=F0V734_NEOCL|nr:conserved hypothetical protein [Neospora caninum Liverpool]CBZ49525.1 conserved hypothetical protein [Neospora caninum Liverpool]CEL64104.1 TPA: Cyclin-U4-1 [Neospora caninum Liverpool]|eukprot:XP_003879560.1 conserved hypothetical protein [Neospora caninum Liverpool]
MSGISAGDEGAGCTPLRPASQDTRESSPDTSSPDTSSPDTSSPDTSSPETSPDTSSPDTSSPETSPDTSSPDTSPETSPDTSPETSRSLSAPHAPRLASRAEASSSSAPSSSLFGSASARGGLGDAEASERAEKPAVPPAETARARFARVASLRRQAPRPAVSGGERKDACAALERDEDFPGVRRVTTDLPISPLARYGDSAAGTVGVGGFFLRGRWAGSGRLGEARGFSPRETASPPGGRLSPSTPPKPARGDRRQRAKEPREGAQTPSLASGRPRLGDRRRFSDCSESSTVADFGTGTPSLVSSGSVLCSSPRRMSSMSDSVPRRRLRSAGQSRRGSWDVYTLDDHNLFEGASEEEDEAASPEREEKDPSGGHAETEGDGDSKETEKEEHDEETEVRQEAPTDVEATVLVDGDENEPGGTDADGAREGDKGEHNQADDRGSARAGGDGNAHMSGSPHNEAAPSSMGAEDASRTRTSDASQSREEEPADAGSSPRGDGASNWAPVQVAETPEQRDSGLPQVDCAEVDVVPEAVSEEGPDESRHQGEKAYLDPPAAGPARREDESGERLLGAEAEPRDTHTEALWEPRDAPVQRAPVSHLPAAEPAFAGERASRHAREFSDLWGQGDARILLNHGSSDVVARLMGWGGLGPVAKAPAAGLQSRLPPLRRHGSAHALRFPVEGSRPSGEGRRPFAQRPALTTRVPSKKEEEEMKQLGRDLAAFLVSSLPLLQDPAYTAALRALLVAHPMMARASLQVPASALASLSQSLDILLQPETGRDAGTPSSSPTSAFASFSSSPDSNPWDFTAQPCPFSEAPEGSASGRSFSQSGLPPHVESLGAGLPGRASGPCGAQSSSRPADPAAQSGLGAWRPADVQTSLAVAGGDGAAADTSARHQTRLWISRALAHVSDLITEQQDLISQDVLQANGDGAAGARALSVPNHPRPGAFPSQSAFGPASARAQGTVDVRRTHAFVSSGNAQSAAGAHTAYGATDGAPLASAPAYPYSHLPISQAAGAHPAGAHAGLSWAPPRSAGNPADELVSVRNTAAAFVYGAADAERLDAQEGGGAPHAFPNYPAPTAAETSLPGHLRREVGYEQPVEAARFRAGCDLARASGVGDGSGVTRLENVTRRPIPGKTVDSLPSERRSLEYGRPLSLDDSRLGPAPSHLGIEDQHAYNRAMERNLRLALLLPWATQNPEPSVAAFRAVPLGPVASEPTALPLNGDAHREDLPSTGPGVYGSAGGVGRQTGDQVAARSEVAFRPLLEPGLLAPGGETHARREMLLNEAPRPPAFAHANASAFPALSSTRQFAQGAVPPASGHAGLAQPAWERQEPDLRSDERAAVERWVRDAPTLAEPRARERETPARVTERVRVLELVGQLQYHVGRIAASISKVQPVSQALCAQAAHAARALKTSAKGARGNEAAFAAEFAAQEPRSNPDAQDRCPVSHSLARLPERALHAFSQGATVSDELPGTGGVPFRAAAAAEARRGEGGDGTAYELHALDQRQCERLHTLALAEYAKLVRSDAPGAEAFPPRVAPSGLEMFQRASGARHVGSEVDASRVQVSVRAHRSFPSGPITSEEIAALARGSDNAASLWVHPGPGRAFCDAPPQHAAVCGFGPHAPRDAFRPALASAQARYVAPRTDERPKEVTRDNNDASEAKALLRLIPDLYTRHPPALGLLLHDSVLPVFFPLHVAEVAALAALVLQQPPRVAAVLDEACLFAVVVSRAEKAKLKRMCACETSAAPARSGDPCRRERGAERTEAHGAGGAATTACVSSGVGDRSSKLWGAPEARECPLENGTACPVGDEPREKREDLCGVRGEKAAATWTCPRSPWRASEGETVTRWDEATLTEGVEAEQAVFSGTGHPSGGPGAANARETCVSASLAVDACLSGEGSETLDPTEFGLDAPVPEWGDARRPLSSPVAGAQLAVSAEAESRRHRDTARQFAPRIYSSSAPPFQRASYAVQSFRPARSERPRAPPTAGAPHFGCGAREEAARPVGEWETEGREELELEELSPSQDTECREFAGMHAACVVTHEGDATHAYRGVSGAEGDADAPGRLCVETDEPWRAESSRSPSLPTSCATYGVSRGETSASDAQSARGLYRDLWRLFAGQHLPSVSIREYVLRLQRFSQISAHEALIAFVLISRVLTRHPHLPFCARNAHRLLLTAFMTVTKAHSDRFYTNGLWAKFGGISVGELNRLEHAFLLLLDHRCLVTLDEFCAAFCLVKEVSSAFPVDLVRAVAAETQAPGMPESNLRLKRGHETPACAEAPPSNPFALGPSANPAATARPRAYPEAFACSRCGFTSCACGVSWNGSSRPSVERAFLPGCGGGRARAASEWDVPGGREDLGASSSIERGWRASLSGTTARAERVGDAVSALGSVNPERVGDAVSALGSVNPERVGDAVSALGSVNPEREGVWDTAHRGQSGDSVSCFAARGAGGPAVRVASGHLGLPVEPTPSRVLEEALWRVSRGEPLPERLWSSADSGAKPNGARCGEIEETGTVWGDYQAQPPVADGHRPAGGSEICGDSGAVRGRGSRQESDVAPGEHVGVPDALEAACRDAVDPEFYERLLVLRTFPFSFLNAQIQRRERQRGARDGLGAQGGGPGPETMRDGSDAAGLWVSQPSRGVESDRFPGDRQATVGTRPGYDRNPRHETYEDRFRHFEKFLTPGDWLLMENPLANLLFCPHPAVEKMCG